MGQLYNIYCDESCHLEHDGEKVMLIGGVWCPSNKKDEIFFSNFPIISSPGIIRSVLRQK